MSFIARSANLVRASGLTSSLYPAVVFILGTLMVTGPAVSFAQLGRAKLTHESQVGSTLSKPKVIYVTDFALDSTQLQSSGFLQEKIQAGGPLRQRLKALRGEDNSPQGRTQSLINLMADSIVQNLQAKGLNAQ